MRFAITLQGLRLAFAAVLALAAAPSAAQGAENLFAARHVAVDATADSAAQARDQAIVEGQRRALDIVLRRLTPEAAHARLPRLDDAGVARLVDGFVVEKERASARRYIAELTVEFRPRAVQELLRGAGLGFVEQRARPLLVLPVLDEDGQLTMFDDPNPWREAWAKVARLRFALVPLVLPLGDLQDVAAVSPEEALAGDEAKLAELARRYGASRWVVAVARPGEDGVNLTLQRPAGAEVETVRAEAGQEPAALLAAAAERLAARIDDAWKRETSAVSASLAAGGPETQLGASATLSSFAEWVALRDRVTRSPAVRRLDVVAISSRETQLVLHHLGSPEQLAQALALQDVELTGEQGFWRLALRGAQAGR
jgi:hypothetical protein